MDDDGDGEDCGKNDGKDDDERAVRTRGKQDKRRARLWKEYAAKACGRAEGEARAWQLARLSVKYYNTDAIQMQY